MVDEIWAKYTGTENVLRNGLLTRYTFIFPRGQWMHITKEGIRKSLPNHTKWGRIELGRKYLGKEKDGKTPKLGEMQYAVGRVTDEEKMTEITNEIFEQAVTELTRKAKNNPETWQISSTKPSAPPPSISLKDKAKSIKAKFDNIAAKKKVA